MNIAMRPIVQAAAKSLHGVREHTDRPIVQCDNGVHLLRGLHELWRDGGATDHFICSSFSSPTPGREMRLADERKR
jgi:hypothetical protein